jgi:hypothetical protein
MDFKQTFLTIGIGLVLFHGCSDTSHIRHYTIQKEATPHVTTQAISTPQEIQWTTPSHWVTQPTSSMRMGSFLIPFSEGEGDLSVIKLGGDAGGMVANVNRWRGQLGLDPHDETEMNKYILKDSSNMGEFIWLTLLNPDDEELGFIISIFTTSNSSIFVKLSASQVGIKELTPEFLSFCKSFNQGQINE